MCLVGNPLGFMHEIGDPVSEMRSSASVARAVLDTGSERTPLVLEEEERSSRKRVRETHLAAETEYTLHLGVVDILVYSTGTKNI